MTRKYHEDEDDDTEELDNKIILILICVSAILALLVIILCIKLFCCQRRRSVLLASYTSENHTLVAAEPRLASSRTARGRDLGSERDYASNPQVEDGQVSSPARNTGMFCCDTSISEHNESAADYHFQNGAFLHIEDGAVPPHQSVAVETAGAASLREVNEEEPEPAAMDHGPPNEAFVMSDDEEVLVDDDEEVLMDSELRELMVPDMKESKLVEVRSKLLVFISRKIDSTGGQLVLDKMGISLFIPPCAIERGKPQTVFLALNWDLKDFPTMSNSQTIVGPVVHVGPHGIRLKRPATLSFRHCAFDTDHVKVYSSETHLMETKAWSLSEATVQRGKDKTHTILDTECQVHISHFTLYTCIAEGNDSKKWLQLVAFGGRMRVHRHYEIRVYLLNNTPCALQFAIENEKKHGFKAIKCPQEYLFNGNGASMCLQVDGVNEGWSANITDLKETVPFLNIWHGKCPFVSFIFKHENVDTKDISTTISAYQESNAEYKLRLKLLAKMPRKKKTSRPHRAESSRSEQESDSYTYSDSSFASSQSSCVGQSPRLISHEFSAGEPQMQSFSDDPQSSDNCCSQSSGRHKTPRKECSKLIPHKLRMILVHLLEPVDTLGNDWRMIASDLGIDTKIPMLKEKSSPFEEVLKIMEEQNKNLDWLVTTLISHQRLDAAGIITSYLQTGVIHS